MDKNDSKINWKFIWIWTIKTAIAFVLEVTVIQVGNLQGHPILTSIVLVLIFFFLLGLVHLSWIVITNLLKRYIKKEKYTDFLPELFYDQKSNAIIVTIHCPDYSILYSKVKVSIQYHKPIIQNTENPKSRYSDIIKKMLNNPTIIESVMWSDYCYEMKIDKRSKKELKIFCFDNEEKCFYLSQENGKPIVYESDNFSTDFRYILFGFGEYDFTLFIKGKSFFYRKQIQSLPFSINYSEKGIDVFLKKTHYAI